MSRLFQSLSVLLFAVSAIFILFDVHLLRFTMGISCFTVHVLCLTSSFTIPLRAAGLASGLTKAWKWQTGAFRANSLEVRLSRGGLTDTSKVCQ